ncbi:Pycsar system effector family protein [Chrysiogenes arsenatis]|uniref:Pycsar system effector family protein n=1 Tax=Chrysiogenes arsenatis TaxID=309797 RepID=UPI000405D0BC|nr:Pycsar system effector family protein [Chrysiogenes arsenatis]
MSDLDTPITPTTSPAPAEEPLLPRLLATNVLNANLVKHMDYNKMADHKASALLTVSTVIITITLAQYDRMDRFVPEILLLTSVVAIYFSLLTIVPQVRDVSGIDIFHYQSFSKISEQEYIALGKKLINDREALYEAYLRDIYYLGSFRLKSKYRKLMYGKWALLAGLVAAGGVTLVR